MTDTISAFFSAFTTFPSSMKLLINYSSVIDPLIQQADPSIVKDCFCKQRTLSKVISFF